MPGRYARRSSSEEFLRTSSTIQGERLGSSGIRGLRLRAPIRVLRYVSPSDGSARQMQDRGFDGRDRLKAGEAHDPLELFLEQVHHPPNPVRSEEHTSELQSLRHL